MYSVMLATMLTTTTAAPDWGHRWGCYSYCGCYGYTGCYWPAYTCGCYYPAFTCGCYYPAYTCGCYGPGYSYWPAYTFGCYWPAYTYSWPIFDSGCYSPAVVSPASPAIGAPGPGGNPPPAGESIPPPTKQIPPGPEKKASSEPVYNSSPPGNTARVTVYLPNEAKLTVDGVSCPLTSSTRSFNTPPLQPSLTYFYTIKAEVVRNGQKYEDTKHVRLLAGKESVVDFGDLRPVQAAMR